MPDSLRLAEFNDRDLLRIIHDVADQEGWADSQHIAERVFPSYMRGKADQQKYALHCVGGRLAWLRRFGVVEKRRESRDVTTHWSLTEAGSMFLTGKITQGQRKLLNGMNDDQLLEITTWLSQNYLSVGPVTATMMRRQWQHGLYRRPKKT